LFINCSALEENKSEAGATLTMRVTDERGAEEALAILRRWRLKRDGAIRESLRVDARRDGVLRMLRAGAAQRRIDSILPPGTPPIVVVDGEQIETLGHLAAVREDLRQSARDMVVNMAGEWPGESWRTVARPVVRAANHILDTCPGGPEAWLLPESMGREWPGAEEVVPGIWVTRRLHGRENRVMCVGLAMTLGLHLLGDTLAPLVLDDPALRLHPDASGWLEALAFAPSPQIIIAGSQETLGFPARMLFGRARWMQFWDAPDYRGTDVIGEEDVTKLRRRPYRVLKSRRRHPSPWRSSEPWRSR
jgi:hypothetical protein